MYQKTFDRLYTGGVPATPSYLIKTAEKKSSESLARESLELHEQHQGAIEIISKLPARDQFVLEVLSVPAVLEPARMITADPARVYEFSTKNK